MGKEDLKRPLKPSVKSAMENKALASLHEPTEQSGECYGKNHFIKFTQGSQRLKK